MPTLEELLEPRNDRERLLVATARFLAFTEVGTLLFNLAQEEKIKTHKGIHLAVRDVVDAMADKEAPEMRRLTWSEMQKEKR